MTEYYEILGLKPGASIEEVKEAYKDLVKVWHPDRFAHDPKLQAKAQEKLKEIIEAYEKLKSHYTEYSNQPPPEEEYQSDSSYQENDPDQEARGNKDHESSSQPPPEPPKEPPSHSEDFTGQARRVYPQPIWHFVLLCIVSFGIYEIYWFYLNWKFIKEHNKLNIYPVWRAIFAPLFAYSLFKKIFNLAEEKGYKEKHSHGLLTFGYIALLILMKLPDPYWLISIFSFVPLITVVKVFNYYLGQEQPNLKVRTKFLGGEIALLIIGGIVLILVLIGTFILATPKNYDDCILKYQKEAKIQRAAAIINLACRGKYSDTVTDCILKNIGDAQTDMAAISILRSCQDKYKVALDFEDPFSSTAHAPAPATDQAPFTNEVISDENRKRANNLLNNKDWQGLLNLSQQLIRAHPNNDNSWNYLGLAYYSLQQYDQAIQAFNEALRIVPNDPILNLNRGNAYLGNSQFDMAITDYSKAITLNSNLSTAYLGCGYSYYNKNDYKRALPDFQKACEMGDKSACKSLKDVKQKQGRDYYQRKLESEENSIANKQKQTSDESKFWSNQGVTSYKDGKYDAAIEDFNKSIALRDSAENYTYRGLAYYKTGQYDKAIEDFTKVIEIEPSNRLAYFNRGSTYYKKGHHDIAVVDFQKACNLGDEDGCKKLKIILEKK